VGHRAQRAATQVKSLAPFADNHPRDRQEAIESYKQGRKSTMKFKNAFLGIAILAALAGSANAATNTFGLTGGMGIPTGDYGDIASKGWHIGATGTHMINQQFGFGGDVAYHAWSASDDVNAAAATLFGTGSEFKWSAIQATAHALMAFPTQSNVKPYAQVGLGLYNVDLKLSSPAGDDSQSKSKFGLNFGGGVNFATKSNMTLGLSGAYHMVQAKDDLGSDVNFFQVGVNVLWGSN
jgi:opacity protein-like surface antigen